jgi:hypothetical protein
MVMLTKFVFFSFVLMQIFYEKSVYFCYFIQGGITKSKSVTIRLNKTSTCITEKEYIVLKRVYSNEW